jgi:hypothetical protein
VYSNTRSTREQQPGTILAAPAHGGQFNEGDTVENPGFFQKPGFFLLANLRAFVYTVGRFGAEITDGCEPKWRAPFF